MNFTKPLQDTPNRVKHLKNIKMIFWVKSKFRPISVQETLNFLAPRCHLPILPRTQNFYVFFDVEYDEKKIFWKKSFLTAGRPFFLIWNRDLALWMHYDDLKLTISDKSDNFMWKIIKIKDKKRLVSFC